MTNRLATSPSLYLRKHAENPIDWWPWIPEALETAQRDNKPIFLSVGYSSCHWCTVMEGEAFSDLAIAAYMNENFLPIKVDREERPDLDSIYMGALQAMTGQGGWPMNMFLAPDDLVPFYGGTYFPVEPRYGRTGFLQVLQGVRQFYDAQKDQLASQKDKLMDYLRRSTELEAEANLSPELLVRGIEVSNAILSRKAPGPSFPMMPYALLALQSDRFGTTVQPSPAQQRGLDLTLGGIYDHVAGGFHRYTVDPTWTVPHFEKMLYDNGQIVEFLANLWSTGHQEPAFQRAIAGTVAWLAREMTAPEGFFYAAQDADNFVQKTDLEPEEGRFYTWSNADLEMLLEAEALSALKIAFDIQPQGNFEHGLIVLQRLAPGPLPPVVEQALAQLFQARYGSLPAALPTFPPARDNTEAKTIHWAGRIPPVTDPKMIVSWNSLMISGLARAATVFQQPDYLAIATKAARFVLNIQWREGRLQRLNYEGLAAVPAQSEDYALLIKALLDLHQASLALNDPTTADTWLTEAQRIQQEFDQHLWDAASGGYRTATQDGKQDLIIQERSWMDNATPAANGIAIANLVRLALLTPHLPWLDQAEQTLKAFGSALTQSPSGCPSLIAALDTYLHATLIRTQPDTLGQLSATHYWPTTLWSLATNLPTAAVGLVCEGLTCLPPLETLEQLQEQAIASQRRHLSQAENG